MIEYNYIQSIIIFKEKIMKMLKMLGFGAALTVCSFALADWYCNHCNKWHNGRCPAVSLGDHHYACIQIPYYEAYECADYDSDDEDEYVEELLHRREYRQAAQACERREYHHDYNINFIYCLIHKHVRNVNDLQRVQDALNDRARYLGIHMNQPHFGCNEDGYGRQNFYGCCDFNHYGRVNIPAFDCNEDRFDYNGYGCHDHYNWRL